MKKPHLAARPVLTTASVEKAPTPPADRQAVDQTIEFLHKLGTSTHDLRMIREKLRQELCAIEQQLTDNERIFREKKAAVDGLVDMIGNASR